MEEEKITFAARRNYAYDVVMRMESEDYEAKHAAAMAFADLNPLMALALKSEKLPEYTRLLESAPAAWQTYVKTN